MLKTRKQFENSYVARKINWIILPLGFLFVAILIFRGQTLSETNDDATYRAILKYGSHFTGFFSELPGAALVWTYKMFPNFPAYSLYLCILLSASYIVVGTTLVRNLSGHSRPIVSALLLVITAFHAVVAARFGITSISILCFVALCFWTLSEHRSFYFWEILIIALLLSGRLIPMIYLPVLAIFVLGHYLGGLRIPKSRIVLVSVVFAVMNATVNLERNSWPAFNESRFLLTETSARPDLSTSQNLDLFLQWWAHDETVVTTTEIESLAQKSKASDSKFWNKISLPFFDRSKLYPLLLSSLLIFLLVLLPKKITATDRVKFLIAPALYTLFVILIDSTRSTWRVTTPLLLGPILVVAPQVLRSTLTKKNFISFLILSFTGLGSYLTLSSNLKDSGHQVHASILQNSLIETIRIENERNSVGILSIVYPCGDSAEDVLNFPLFHETSLPSFNNIVPVGWLARHPTQIAFFREKKVSSMAELIASGQGFFICKRNSVFQNNVGYESLLRRWKYSNCAKQSFQRTKTYHHLDIYRWGCNSPGELAVDNGKSL